MPSLEHANCVGATPELFEATTKNERTAFRAALPALAYCLDCPCKKECLDLIQPAENASSIVAGGFVWVNGKKITRASITFTETEPTADELVTERFGDLADLEQELVA